MARLTAEPEARRSMLRKTSKTRDMVAGIEQCSVSDHDLTSRGELLPKGRVAASRKNPLNKKGPGHGCRME